ncbi:hypothetical protein ColTof3_01084 [Colletotrichum tofieldiae]|nr:hypothetical protein ColTof3_01084 [Colletotrichum tofieldiae]
MAVSMTHALAIQDIPAFRCASAMSAYRAKKRPKDKQCPYGVTYNISGDAATNGHGHRASSGG